MNETFMLYLFTRLSSIEAGLTILFVILLIASIVLSVPYSILTFEGEKPPKAIHKIWIATGVVMFLGVVIPSQKDAAIMLAGSTIMQLSKTDEAQRLAGKSVQVIEMYLDEMLKSKE